MTYVSEYFHCFASQDIKEKAARRIQKFVQFNQSIEQMQIDYETQVSTSYKIYLFNYNYN